MIPYSYLLWSSLCKTKLFKEVQSNRWMIEMYGFLYCEKMHRFLDFFTTRLYVMQYRVYYISLKTIIFWIWKLHFLRATWTHPWTLMSKLKEMKGGLQTFWASFKQRIILWYSKDSSLCSRSFLLVATCQLSWGKWAYPILYYPQACFTYTRDN